MNDDRKIHCKICGKAYTLWFIRGGKKVNGFDDLKNHYANVHMEEYLKLQERLNARPERY